MEHHCLAAGAGHVIVLFSNGFNSVGTWNVEHHRSMNVPTQVAGKGTQMPQILSPREILEILVSFPTVSSETNLPLIDWVEDYLAGHGVGATRVYDDTGKKAALFAQIGPNVDGGVILSGHTDVVPVEGQEWSTDPFTVVEKDGRLYGRGTADMKGFDALALAAVPRALAANLKRPLQIALSYDEEIGCVGAPRMIDRMTKDLPKAAAVIVGEPSRMKTVTGHKGSTGLRIHMRGYEVHSSTPHLGVSAVMEGARLIHWANEENERIAGLPIRDEDRPFDPPYSTLHVGVINGGTANNITARDCHFGMSWRFVPGEDREQRFADFSAKVHEIETAMKSVRPEAGISVEPTYDVPPLIPETNGYAESLCRALTGDNGNHVVSYGTEAGQFQQAGYSAAVCGPGDIAQAHQADEYIELSELEAGQAFLEGLIRRLEEE